MKYPVLFLTITGILVCGALWCGVFGQAAPPSIDDEIARLRKELIQTQVDVERTSQEIDKDRKDFEAYRARTVQRLAQTQGQLDTLKSETLEQSRASDALEAKISEAIAGRREIELSQDEFRRKLVSFCSGVQPEVKKLPPLIMAPMLSGLSLLMSDLTTKSIDIVEGCTRLVQILNKLDEAGSGIQISQESSPVADIRGTVYRLRIGTIFEAVVDTKGEKCAVFSGWGGDGAARWKDLGSPILAQAVLQAVNIREGKSLPAFVNLPLAGQGGAK
ncbi:MAG: DUF3450 family protein [Chitinivibrionales bacterium]